MCKRKGNDAGSPRDLLLGENPTLRLAHTAETSAEPEKQRPELMPRPSADCQVHRGGCCFAPLCLMLLLLLVTGTGQRQREDIPVEIQDSAQASGALP